MQPARYYAWNELIKFFRVRPGTAGSRQVSVVSRGPFSDFFISTCWLVSTSFRRRFFARVSARLGSAWLAWARLFPIIFLQCSRARFSSNLGEHFWNEFLLDPVRDRSCEKNTSWNTARVVNVISARVTIDDCTYPVHCLHILNIGWQSLLVQTRAYRMIRYRVGYRLLWMKLCANVKRRARFLISFAVFSLCKPC